MLREAPVADVRVPGEKLFHGAGDVLVAVLAADAAHVRRHWVRAVGRLRDEAERPAAAAERTEEIRVRVAGAGLHDAAVRENYLGLQQVGGARAVHAAVVAIAAHEREAHVAHGGARAAHEEAAALPCLVVDLPEHHPRAERRSRPGGLRAAVGDEVVQPLRLRVLVRPEHQVATACQGGAPRPVVAGVLHGQRDVVLRGELDGLAGVLGGQHRDVLRRGRVGDRPARAQGRALLAYVLHARRLVCQPQWVREMGTLLIRRVDGLHVHGLDARRGKLLPGGRVEARVRPGAPAASPGRSRRDASL
mmetsp:Transcript_109516/g.285459  ORF Transcript_109516/g.285459 Transcript_109516/m.285459 type:complete len:305 (+) Transcript_109516:911-1825(+)